MYLANAFSLQMLENLNECHNIITIPLTVDEVNSKEWESAIGHQDTANVLSDILGRPVPCNRANISLKRGDSLIVAQLTGGRLPEGVTTLPDDFGLRFIQVDIDD